jgi:hypothetical protein
LAWATSAIEGRPAGAVDVEGVVAAEVGAFDVVTRAAWVGAGVADVKVAVAAVPVPFVVRSTARSRW